MTDKINLVSNEEIISLIPGNVYWKDREGRYVGSNEENALCGGLSSREEIIGKKDSDLSWGQNVDLYHSHDQEVLNTGKTIVAEEYGIMGNGEMIYFISKKRALKNQAGEIIGIIGTSIEITDLKKKEDELKRSREKAEEANRAKTNFLAVISHELRTPLNGIFGMSQILHEKLKDDHLLGYVKDIEQSASHLLALVSDILDFSSIESGKVRVRKSPFNLDEIAKSSLAEIKFKMREKPIRLVYQCDTEVPRWILGDSVRIKQVILNLMGNAIKFTQQGIIKIIISCIEKTQKSVRLKIGVRDTGIGIPKVMQQKIFERFVQMESEYDRSFEGVGLGLAICKQIIEAMGGTIQVESEEGSGSFFSMEIPFELPNENQYKQLMAEISRATIRDQFEATVLVVEDNVLNQKVAKNMLESLGCHVDIVDSGVEAISRVKEKQYDLVFMDVGLPNMDGLTVTEHLRHDFSNEDLPIIGLTAHALEADIERCYQASMNDVVTKPITIENLKRILSKWIKTI